MFCNNCGKELEAGDVFCGYCGARLEPVPEPIVAESVQPTQESPVTSVPPVSGNSTAGEGFSTSMEVTAPTWADNWKHNEGISNLIIMGIFILWLFGVLSPIANFFGVPSDPPPMVGLSMLLTAAIDVGGILFIMVIHLGALILSFPFLPLLPPEIYLLVSFIWSATGLVYPFIFAFQGDFFINIMGLGNAIGLMWFPMFIFGNEAQKLDQSPSPDRTEYYNQLRWTGENEHIPQLAQKVNSTGTYKAEYKGYKLVRISWEQGNESWTCKINDDGTLEESYQEGTEFCRERKVHAAKIIYDGVGNNTRQEFYGVDGRLKENIHGIAIYEPEYDSSGKEIACRCYNAKGDFLGYVELD